MSVNYKKLASGEIIPLNVDLIFTSIFNKEENIDISLISQITGLSIDEIKNIK